MKIIWPQIREFCACIFYCLTDSALRQSERKCATFCPLSFCRKGLTASRQGPYGIATRPPSSLNGGPVATPGGPPWSATDGFSDDSNSGMSIFRKRHAPELKFSSVKFRDIIVTHRKNSCSVHPIPNPRFLWSNRRGRIYQKRSKIVRLCHFFMSVFSFIEKINYICT